MLHLQLAKLVCAVRVAAPPVTKRRETRNREVSRQRCSKRMTTNSKGAVAVGKTNVESRICRERGVRADQSLRVLQSRPRSAAGPTK